MRVVNIFYYYDERIAAEEEVTYPLLLYHYRLGRSIATTRRGIHYHYRFHKERLPAKK
jgi:hypothetical protein